MAWFSLPARLLNVFRPTAATTELPVSADPPLEAAAVPVTVAHAEASFTEAAPGEARALQTVPRPADRVPVRPVGWSAGASAGGPTLDTYVAGQEVLVVKPERRGGASKPEKAPEPKRARIIGHDTRGRAVVVAHGRKTVVSFKALRWPSEPATGEVPPRRGSAERLLEGMPPDRIHPVDPRLSAAWKIALQRKVVGETTAQQLVDALQRQGHSVMLVGGAVRDAMKMLELDPTVTPEQLASKFHDLDIVTSATVSELEPLILAVVGKSVRECSWTTAVQDRYGIIGVGQRKHGMDIACMRTISKVDKQVVLGTNVVEDAAARDFSVNQLYVLLGNPDQLVDASGHGLEDLKAGVLRSNREQVANNNLLALRYMKFRVRGLTLAEGEAEDMRSNARHHLHEPNGSPWGWSSAFMRIVPSEVTDAASLDAYLAQLKQVLAEDGLSDLYDRYVGPGRDAVIAELGQRAKWAQ